MSDWQRLLFSTYLSHCFYGRTKLIQTSMLVLRYWFKKLLFWNGVQRKLQKHVEERTMTMPKILYTLVSPLRWLIDFWCLTALSAIFQLYHGDQFQWWKKPERTTDHGQATGKLYHLQLQVECTLFCNLQSWARTHAVLVIGLYELLGNPSTQFIEPPGPSAPLDFEVLGFSLPSL